VYLNFLNKYSHRRLLIIFFLLSLILRVIYGLYFYFKHNTANFDDDWAYINYAEAMIQQGIFVRDISAMSQTKSGIAPFYPFLIFLSFKIFGIKYIPLIILNAALSSSLTLIIFYVGKYLFNDKVGIMSSFWTIIYINTIRWIPTLLKENLLQLLFALFVLLLLVYLIKNHGYFILTLLSFIFTILIHTDERYIIYYIVLIIVIFLITESSIKEKILAVVYLNVIIVALMTPWLIRNYEVYQRPVILSERTAFFTDKLFGYKNDNYFNQEIQVSDATLDSIIKGMPVNDMTMYNLIQRGISYGMYPRRFSKIEKMYSDFKELWRPFRFSDMWVSEGYRPEGKWSLSHNISLILTYGVLLPFFLAGIYYCIKTKNKVSFVLIGIVLIHTIIHTTIVLSQNRYRIPIDVIIIVIAFYGLTEIIRKRTGQKENHE